MKIGIVSDSHDRVPKIRAAMERLGEEGVDLLIHAGDFVSPFALKEFLKGPFDFVGVFGNNDGERVLLSEMAPGRIHPSPFEFTRDGLRIMVLHEPFALEAAVTCGLFDLVVYGHTHEPVCRREGKTLILNPGELGGWLSGRFTLGIYDSATREGKVLDLEPKTGSPE